jgi:hypothetical protein
MEDRPGPEAAMQSGFDHPVPFMDGCGNAPNHLRRILVDGGFAIALLRGGDFEPAHLQHQVTPDRQPAVAARDALFQQSQQRLPLLREMRALVQNAAIPVCARPRISAWMSCVPS